MRFFTTLIITTFIFLTVTISSCSLKQQQLLFKERGPNPDSLTAVLKNSGNGTSDYRIRSQDILQIRNLQNIRYVVEEAPSSPVGGGGGISQQGQTYQVEDDGTVALPVIGRIHVAGLTRTEAMKLIEDVPVHEEFATGKYF